ncbi:hypothetical protein EVJ58_g8566 [Rhodofomes roseus]|uniref:RING-type domain-containing protein n=1 Tax=Rhodofomes roseus TaxID=34475 RepID=A0A4Y9XZN4_9APHY|nr:hypothetical protein EVJ58_g8566 [Rhodofomes roseus]
MAHELEDTFRQLPQMLQDALQEVGRLKAQARRRKYDADATTCRLRRQVQEAKEEAKHFRTRLNEQHTRATEHVVNWLSELADFVACGICASELRRPYVLACGHIYCYDCLYALFSQALAALAHDMLNIHNLETLQLCRHIDQSGHFPANIHTYAQQVLADFEAIRGRAQYTCPMCRTAITVKPVEDLALKQIMNRIAAARAEYGHALHADAAVIPDVEGGDDAPYPAIVTEYSIWQ